MLRTCQLPLRSTPKSKNSYYGIQQQIQKFNSRYSRSLIVVTTFKQNRHLKRMDPYFNPFSCCLLLHLSWWMWKCSQFPTADRRWAVHQRFTEPKDHAPRRPRNSHCCFVYVLPQVQQCYVLFSITCSTMTSRLRPRCARWYKCIIRGTQDEKDDVVYWFSFFTITGN